MPTLIITNGDSAADLLQVAPDVTADTYLPWRDMLHSGPLTYSDDAAAFYVPRLDFFEAFGVERDGVRADFEARERLLADNRAFERIEIWLEHDLYDQLQLVQILDSLSRLHGRTDGIFLVQSDDYLGKQTPETVGRFADLQVPVADTTFRAATALWRILCQCDPTGIYETAKTPVDGFPHMQAAFGRFLEELPGLDGITRTQRTVLKLIAEGESVPKHLFGIAQAREDAAFFGDLGFFAELDAVSFCPASLVEGLPEPSRDAINVGSAQRNAYLNARVGLTDFGRAVYADSADFLSRNPIDRWWAGTHLKSGSVWRYDKESDRLLAP